jgi:hypothetical protein
MGQVPVCTDGRPLSNNFGICGSATQLSLDLDSHHRHRDLGYAIKSIFTLLTSLSLTCAGPVSNMAWFKYLRKIYSLDTLDTRFVTSAHSPPREAATELRIDPTKPSPTESSRSHPASDVHPALWRTPEFLIYALTFIIVVPLMFKSPMDVSKCRAAPLPYARYHDLSN